LIDSKTVSWKACIEGCEMKPEYDTLESTEMVWRSVE
jgi:hypothetical protein